MTPRQKAIFAALPGTALHLANRLLLSKARVSDALVVLRAKKLVRIVRWEIKGDRIAAVYGPGSDPDAEKPLKETP